MGLFANLARRRAIARWAADQSLMAERTLCQVAADMIRRAEARADAPEWAGTPGPAAFLEREVVPLIREVAEPVAESIVAQANAALAPYSDRAVVWIRRPLPAIEPDGVIAGFNTVAVEAVSLIGGAAGLTAGQKLREQAASRLRHRAHGYVQAAVIKGSKAEPALLQQLAAEIARTARAARG